jgi:alkylation response protein AidB-like acyl-CoA dehydrogenase
VDFGVVELTDEARAFWAELREFLDEQLTDDLRAAVHVAGSDFYEPFQRAMGARGWLMPHWGTHEGGAALDPVRRHILALELSRQAAPINIIDTTAIGAEAVKAWGSDELRAEVLPGVTSGAIRICLGYTEPDAGSDLAAVRTRAVRAGDDWIINGSKMFTTGAQVSQFSFLLARTNTEVAKHKGLTMFLVPLDDPGVSVGPIETLGGERTNVVYYGDVRITDKYRLGPVDGGWSVLSAPLDEEHGIGTANGQGLGEINGQGAWHNRSLQRIFAAAHRWAVTPDADGDAPIDEQATAARLAQVAMDIEVARSTPGAMGRLVAAELLIQDAADLIDLAAPDSLIARGESGAVEDGTFEWGHRFAPGSAIYGGTVEIQRNIIAQRFLGLPRPLMPSASKQSDPGKG